jgi:glycosyltransferase involved in cell wall biosynthesis
MRIAMLAHKLSFAGDYRQTGVSRYIEFLLRYLPHELHEGEELAVLAGPDVRRENHSSSFDPSLEWHWSRWPTGKVPVRVLWEQIAAPFATQNVRADVIHGPVNVVPLARAGRSIATIHDLAFLAFPEQYPRGQRTYLKAMTSASAHRCGKVIAVSESTRRDVIERLNVAPDRVIAVPNGVSEEFYPRAHSPELDAFREANQLPAQFLLFIGTLQPRKNLLGLLRGYESLAASERLPLYVVGSPGWMYADIFHEVQRLGIADHVRFPGFATSEALPLWYSAATAFVYPSFYEGFGLPVLESMACGTPVITSNVTSLPEVVGDAGLTVDPDYPDAIAEGIRTLLGDDDLRARLAERGMTRARQFTWKRTARETAAVYRDVAAQT